MTEAKARPEVIQEVEDLENYSKIKTVYKWFKSCFTCENQVNKRTRSIGGSIDRGEGCTVKEIKKKHYMKHRLPLTNEKHKDCRFYVPTKKIVSQFKNYEKNKKSTFHRIFHGDIIDDEEEVEA